MTPPNKAYNLYHKFYNTLLPNVRERQRIAIEHSLIAVEEILEATKTEIDRPEFTGTVYNKYWQEVKNELLKQQNT
jgi:hypothetical protein